MSMDLLQEKIRKFKNPSILQLNALINTVPPQFLSDKSGVEAYRIYTKILLESLREHIPAVRFGFAGFAAFGADGISALSQLLQNAKELGYYVILDLPELHSQLAAEIWAHTLSAESTEYPCDGVIIPCYAGSDVIRPFSDLCKAGKSLFCVVRTANRSATEVQDLLTGSRLVHTAASDIVNRHAEPYIGKCGYFQIGALAAASSADSIRTLRSKYKRLFLLLDGYDYPNSNAKNCSFAFDALGHGAAACAGLSLTAAWKEDGNTADDFVKAAVQAAERMKKNLTRYVSVL